MTKRDRIKPRLWVLGFCRLRDSAGTSWILDSNNLAKRINAAVRSK